jgi:hypothetical protein
MATKKPKLYRHAQIKLYRNRGYQDVTSHTNAAAMETGNYGNPNRSVTVRVLHKVDDDDNDDDNDDNDDDVYGFYCLIFGFVRWSRENNHNAGLHNFLIFTR